MCGRDAVTSAAVGCVVYAAWGRIAFTPNEYRCKICRAYFDFLHGLECEDLHSMVVWSGLVVYVDGFVVRVWLYDLTVRSLSFFVVGARRCARPWSYSGGKQT